MNRTLKTLIIFATVLLPAVSLAQNQGPSIGVILGWPTGFAGKYIFKPRAAIAANLGFALFGSQMFHATCDYQFLFPQTLRWRDEFEEKSYEMKGLTPYLGIGGRFLFKHDENDNTALFVGLRIGGGIEWAINRFALFLEVYPVVNVIPGTSMDCEGGLGLRFYLRE